MKSLAWESIGNRRFQPGAMMTPNSGSQDAGNVAAISAPAYFHYHGTFVF
jgi:hypothetical protein